MCTCEVSQVLTIPQNWSDNRDTANRTERAKTLLKIKNTDHVEKISKIRINDYTGSFPSSDSERMNE